MTKVISISDEAYEKLSRLKTEEENSFSKVIMKLTGGEGGEGIMKFWGICRESSEMDDIYKDILARRNKAKPRKVKF